MKRPGPRRLLLLLVVCVVIPSWVAASPSGDTVPPTFTKRGSYWYDSWGINRNVYSGDEGYLPNMFYETIDSYADLAYAWGLDFQRHHLEQLERAQAILRFVQEWTVYGYDEDTVVRDGEPQLEWAWNGDEMAYMIQHAQETLGVVPADCEDVAFLCATLYYGAGFDVAIVEAPDHCALLIWLPEYPHANLYWDIHDGRGYGWIWVEATGKNNPLGWTPPSFSDGDFTAYPIARNVGDGIRIEEVSYAPSAPSPGEAVDVSARVTSPGAPVQGVTLIYSVNEGPEEREAMVCVDDSWYQGQIPGQASGSEVVFRVQAAGEEGDTAQSGNLSYVVTETIFGVEPLLFYVVIGIVVILLVAAMA